MVAQERGELFTEVVDLLADRFHDKALRKRIPELAAPFRAAAASSASLAEERAVVHAFLGTIPASHLALYSKATHDRLQAELANRRMPTCGFQLVGIGARFFVHDVLEGSPAAEAGLRRGDRVLTIDGVPVGASPRLDWRSDDAALPDLPLHDVLCKADERVSLVVEARPGVVRTVELVAKRWSGALAAKASIRVLERDDRRFGYLHLRYMHLTGVGALVRGALDGPFAECDGVILDLRGRGGSAATVDELANLLERYRSKLRFAFLVDGETRSAKEAFAAEVRKRKLGVLVGERTAGALLPATFQPIGTESVLMFPAFTLGALSNAIEGKGVAPDVAASAELPWSEGRDGILDAALATLARPATR